MTEPDAALLQIFHEETSERLGQIEDSLLALEGGTAAADTVDALFRDVHSIKGNAGMMGFEEARAIAHAMEDLLDGARERGRLAPELVDPLLRAADAVRRAVAGESGLAERVVADLRPEPGSGAPGEAPAREARAVEDRATEAPEPTARPEPAPHPAASIRVEPAKVDALIDSVGEIGLRQRRLAHRLGSGASAGADGPGAEEMDACERLLDGLQDAALQLRTLPLTSITGRFPRAIRDLSHREGKQVELVMSGTETQLDRLLLDGISETIIHLLNNAVIHGIESRQDREAAGKPPVGRVELRAEQRGRMIAIEVADDGRGVAELERRAGGGSLLDMLTTPGFSTASEVTETAGRGVGLDAVKAHVEGLGGSLEMVSEPGAGTTFVLLLPPTLALLRVLVLERGGQAFAIALASVSEALQVSARTSLAGRPALELRGRSVALADLAATIGASASAVADRPPAVVVVSGGDRVALMCDAVLGEQEVVVKGLGPLLAGVPGYLGAGILADGRVALILDPSLLVERGVRGEALPPAPEQPARTISPSALPAPLKVLVVDDQFTVRELQRSILEAAGYRVETARDGREALATLAGDERIGLVVTDIQMPELDGLGLLRAIREDAGRSELPVIVVSSQGTDDDRRLGAAAGADAYMVKHDFDQRALLDTVERLVGA